MLKIGINGWYLTKPYSGIGQHTKNLILELLELDCQLTVVTPEPVSLPSHKNLQEVQLIAPRFFSPGLKKNYFEHVQVPGFFKKSKIDILHVPYPAVPFFKGKLKTTATLHDVIPWKFDEYIQGIFSGLAHWLRYMTMLRADHIIFVSKFSKQEYEDLIKSKFENSTVIHNAADEIYKNKVSPEEISIIKGKYKIKKPFLIYVGGYDKRKNVEMLLEAYKNFQEKYDLVLAGGKQQNSNLYKSFDQDIGIKTGFIEEKELATLYQGAVALINFSKYEGFNLPLIESAYSNCPVVCSNTKVHQEVLGSDYPGLFENTKQGITKAFNQLEDEHLIKSLNSHLPKITKKYSYKEMASKTLEIFQTVANL